MKVVLTFVSVFLLTNSLVGLLVASPLTNQQLAPRPWDISPHVSAHIDLAAIRFQFAEIATADDLQRLLTAINSNHPFLNLEAIYQDTGWYIDGTPANVISQIKLVVVTSQLSEPLALIQQKFVGHVDSDDSRKKVLNQIKKILNEQGFPNHDIKFQAHIKQSKAIYEISVDEGSPCLIASINLPFKLPSNVDMPILIGNICNSAQILDESDNLEQQLRDKGYVQVELNFESLKYSNNRQQCHVQFQGKLGQRIEYVIVDDSRNIADDILSPDNYEEIDFRISDPESMHDEITKYYRNNGYEDVIVSAPELRRKDDHAIMYIYHVQPGNVYTVDEIQFEGNRYLSRDQLLDIMGLTDFWDISLPLNRDEINQGVDAIENEYLRSGYWNVAVRSPRITKSKVTSTAQVIVVIHEGRQRLLNKVNFEGNSVFSNTFLSEQISNISGMKINKSDIAHIEEQIRSLYLKKGYIYAQVMIDIRSTNVANFIQTDLTFKISEGARVRTGTINIRGLIKTDPKIVRRELQFQQGEWYNPEDIEQSRKNLIGLGIFSSVQISVAELTSQSTQPTIVNLLIEVNEGRAGNVSFGPGYNIRRGFNYVTEFSYKNIAGQNRQLSLRASVSQEKHQNAIGNSEDSEGKMFLGRKVGIGYIEPYILDLPIDGNVSLSHIGVAETIWKISNILELGLSHSFHLSNYQGKISGIYNLKQSKDEGSKIQEDSLITSGNTRIGSLGLRVLLDSRDSLSWPSSGGLSRIDLQVARYALGGKYNFFKYELRTSRYIKIWQNVVFATSLNLTSYEYISGRVNPGGIDVLPATERLSAHGVDYVRGFQEELGPYAEIDGVKNVINGTSRFVLKTELRYRWHEQLGTTIFLDSGNTFLSDSEMEKFGRGFSAIQDGPVVEDNTSYKFHELLYRPGYLFSRNYLSYGTSLSWLTPIGAVNASLAFPMREPKNRRCEQLGICFSRAKNKDLWFQRYQFDLSVGAEF